MTVAGTIKAAKTVDAIAESLMKCGKVKDMAEAFRTVTGRDFTGRIVGVNKDNLSYDMAREIKMQFERESFAALTVSEKITFLCERDAYDTGRFLTVCRVEELREIAQSIGADTAGVRTEYEMTEKLDYMSAISEKLLFRIGYAQHKHAEEKGTTQCAEITNASDNDNALALQPANDANIQRDTNDNAKSLLDADYFKGKSIDEIKRAFSGASLVQLKGFALCYTIPYFSRMNKSKLIDALASKISLILEERNGYMTAENVTGDNGYALQDDIIIPAPKPRTIPQPVSVKFIPGTVYYGNDSGNHYPVKIIARTADAVTTDFIGAWIKEAKIQTIAGVEYAAFMTQYRNIEIWADKQEPSGKPQSEDTAQPEISAPAEITQPDALYIDDSYSDAPGDNSCPNQDIPESHSPVKVNHHEEKFLQCRSISAKTKEITAMLNRYAEINGTVRAIHDGIKIFRKGIKIRERQGLPTDGLEKAIKEVKPKYREWRVEAFKLRRKLLRVMSAEEIRRACEMYIARCERIRRRHMRK